VVENSVVEVGRGEGFLAGIVLLKGLADLAEVARNALLVADCQKMLETLQRVPLVDVVRQVVKPVGHEVLKFNPHGGIHTVLALEAIVARGTGAVYVVGRLVGGRSGTRRHSQKMLCYII